MLSRKRYFIFIISNTQHYAVYMCAIGSCMPSRRLRRLDAPLVIITKTPFQTFKALGTQYNRITKLHRRTHSYGNLSVADSPRSRIMKYPILLKEVKKKVQCTVYLHMYMYIQYTMYVHVQFPCSRAVPLTLPLLHMRGTLVHVLLSRCVFPPPPPPPPPAV